MSKQETYLSHHEQLRLEYLEKSIHYLNEREQKELAYLRYKAKGHPVSQPRRQGSKASLDHAGNYSDSEISDLDKDFSDPIPALESNPSTRTQRKKIKKKRKGKIRGFLKLLFLILLITLVGMGFMFYKGMTSVTNDPNIQSAQVEPFDGEETANGVNILILGTDGRVGESSEATRTDSIMVLNVNNKEKKIKLVSFMRDTLVSIEGTDYKLNLAYTFGEQDKQIGGANNVRQVLKENFDIAIQYYALVDFSTFAIAIDTLFPNGVTIDAQFSTIDGQTVTEVEVPDDLNIENGIVPTQTISVGTQQMDGRTLLNYARFRKDDEGDYGRTRRQQQVLSAIFAQIKDPTKLFTGSEAAGKVFSLTSTNIPYSFLLTNGVGVALDSSNGIEQVTIPENEDWINEYDTYGGLGLKIDFEKYKTVLSNIGLR